MLADYLDSDHLFAAICLSVLVFPLALLPLALLPLALLPLALLSLAVFPFQPGSLQQIARPAQYAKQQAQQPQTSGLCYIWCFLHVNLLPMFAGRRQRGSREAMRPPRGDTKKDAGGRGASKVICCEGEGGAGVGSISVQLEATTARARSCDYKKQN